MDEKSNHLICVYKFSHEELVDLLDDLSVDDIDDIYVDVLMVSPGVVEIDLVD